ncbi:Uncharacterised protein [Mycobacteroides abscessus subsp. abscessus]|nr:Uncharacterised protein [Mycobacteroides abscessus subsp. abscessus]
MRGDYRMRNSSFIAALTVSAVTAVISAPPGHASTDCSQEGIAQAVQATNSALGICTCSPNP